MTGRHMSGVSHKRAFYERMRRTYNSSTSCRSAHAYVQRHLAACLYTRQSGSCTTCRPLISQGKCPTPFMCVSSISVCDVVQVPSDV